LALFRMRPYEPLNQLKPVAENIWIVDGPIIDMKYFFLPVSIPFPTRMTIVRLANGDLWVHSPGELPASLKAEIDALGPVAHIVAPNRIHYWWVADWAKTYPAARLYAAPGVREQAEKKKPFALDEELTDEVPVAWAGEIDQVAVPGGFLTEIDFFHRASRTLILTDLIENFEEAKIETGWVKPLMRWSGAADPDGAMPIDLRATFRGHEDAFRAAVKTMIGWAPERILLAHGRWYDKDAVAELKRAFRWLGDLEA